LKQSIVMMKVWFIILFFCITSCGDPADQIITVKIGGETSVPVRVGDFEWEKNDGLWYARTKIVGSASYGILFPSEPNDYKAIERYMKR
jgi:hypothetical protein